MWMICFMWSRCFLATKIHGKMTSSADTRSIIAKGASVEIELMSRQLIVRKLAVHTYQGGCKSQEQTGWRRSLLEWATGSSSRCGSDDTWFGAHIIKWEPPWITQETAKCGPEQRPKWKQKDHEYFYANDAKKDEICPNWCKKVMIIIIS